MFTPKKLTLSHNVIATEIAILVIKTILRYLLMTGYLLSCKELGLYDYSFVTKAMVTLSGICMSRWVLREIGRMFACKMDEPLFEDVGIVHCIRGIVEMKNRW